MESTGELLRRARRLAGLTQVEAARRSGIDQTTWSAYERSRREPGAATWLRLLQAVGASWALTPGVPDQPGGLAGELATHRQAVLDVLRDAGMSEARVFGSVARGEATAASDVDLLVRVPEGTGLFKLLQVQGQLQRLLGVSVDLVPEASLRSDVRPAVLRDAVPL
ncbi:MAG: nucleotidyltransferase domain-containing protein [Ornithinimicrobium sp.]|uniref:nucleotidyltransferase domain-containing protein n=1 Tax=Ornithinimicrobium sp. TaxID=1977084 RepID=UPI003D9B7EF7